MSIHKSILQPEHWLKLYGDYLYSMAVLKVGSLQTAEDLVQETFMAAFKAKDSFKNDSSEKTWLIAILKNKIIDHYRKKDVLKNATEYIAETEAEFLGHFFNQADGHWLNEVSPHTWKENADDSMNRNEFYKVFRFCMEKLPPKLVPVFTAKILDDEDADTICKDNNISSSNYWVIIHRAKLLMRSCLEKNWFLR